MFYCSFHLFLISDKRVVSKTGKQFTRRKWTKREMDLIFTRFHRQVVGSTLAGMTECKRLMVDKKVVDGRNWSNLKDFVRNPKVKLARQTKQTIREDD